MDRLVELLLNPGRGRPVVVVTVAPGHTAPFIDADSIAQQSSGGADVYVVPTGPLTFRMADALGAMACVYGGAGRLYAPGTSWREDPYTSKLRFARNPAEGQRATEELISDVLGAVFATGTERSAPPAARPAAGQVAGFAAAGRALVRLDDGSLATIWSELLVPGHPIERLVSVGMPVHGELDPDNRRLDVGGMRQSATEALKTYAAGQVVQARVAGLAADHVDVELYPDVSARLTAADVTTNERDDLSDLMSTGETLAVRVVRTPSGVVGRWQLTMSDIDDDEPIEPAPPVLLGGPPWLAIGAAPAAALSPSETPPGQFVTEPAPRFPTAPPVAPPAPVAQLRQQASELAQENTLLETERRQQHEKVRTLQATVERLRTQLRHARSKARRPSPADKVSAGFADPVEQLRWDVTRTWVDRIASSEKARLPLKQYAVGPQFIESLERVQGISRDKVLEVLVDLLVGRPLADAHPLRRSEAGDPVVREDGAVCMRMPLQTKSPSARRLHYWKGPGERIELARVVVHDDFSP